jgi:hypothetical protein
MDHEAEQLLHLGLEAESFPAGGGFHDVQLPGLT